MDMFASLHIKIILLIRNKLLRIIILILLLNEINIINYSLIWFLLYLCEFLVAIKQSYILFLWKQYCTEQRHLLQVNQTSKSTGFLLRTVVGCDAILVVELNVPTIAKW